MYDSVGEQSSTAFKGHGAGAREVGELLVSDLTLSLTQYILPEMYNYLSEVMRIGGIVISHLSKL